MCSCFGDIGIETLEHDHQSSNKRNKKLNKIDDDACENLVTDEFLNMLLFPSGASHSMFGEMKTITQETPSSVKPSNLGNNNSTYRDEDIDDEFERIIRFSSGPPK